MNCTGEGQVQWVVCVRACFCGDGDGANVRGGYDGERSGFALLEESVSGYGEVYQPF